MCVRKLGVDFHIPYYPPNSEPRGMAPPHALIRLKSYCRRGNLKARRGNLPLRRGRGKGAEEHEPSPQAGDEVRGLGSPPCPAEAPQGAAPGVVDPLWPLGAAPRIDVSALGSRHPRHGAERAAGAGAGRAGSGPALRHDPGRLRGLRGAGRPSAPLRRGGGRAGPRQALLGARPQAAAGCGGSAAAVRRGGRPHRALPPR